MPLCLPAVNANASYCCRARSEPNGRLSIAPIAVAHLSWRMDNRCSSLAAFAMGRPTRAERERHATGRSGPGSEAGTEHFAVTTSDGKRPKACLTSSRPVEPAGHRLDGARPAWVGHRTDPPIGQGGGSCAEGGPRSDQPFCAGTNCTRPDSSLNTQPGRASVAPLGMWWPASMGGRNPSGFSVGWWTP